MSNISEPASGLSLLRRDEPVLPSERLRLAGLAKESIVDGPGLRLVVFVQGCPHRCPGCHNPATHAYKSEQPLVETAAILGEIRSNPLLDGVTLSGGEPFEQALELASLAREVKRMGLHVMTYTGYTFEALWQGLENRTGWRKLLETTDVLVDGPFILERRSFKLPFRGSDNQRLLDAPASLKLGRAVPAGF